jgi:hypothetical protein
VECAFAVSSSSIQWKTISGCFAPTTSHSYYLETLHFAFSCPYQKPCEEVQSIPCPWDPPRPPNEEFGGPDLGLDHERE